MGIIKIFINYAIPYDRHCLFNIKCHIYQPQTIFFAYLDQVLLHYRKGQNNALSGCRIKTSVPHHAFNVFYDTKKELEAQGVYESVWKSFANIVVETIFPHLDMITAENFSIYRECFNIKFINNMRILELDEKEIVFDKFRSEINSLRMSGFDGLFFQRFFDNSHKLDEVLNSINFDQRVLSPLYWLTDGIKVIIYGMGYRGRKLYKDIKYSRYNIKIVALADRNAATFKNKYSEDVITPEKIDGYDFDYVIVAVNYYCTMCEIREKLISLNIDEKKRLFRHVDGSTSRKIAGINPAS